MHKRIRRIAAALTAVAALGGWWHAPHTATAAATTPAPLGVPGAWKSDFADEFNGTAVDTGKWNIAGHAPNGALNCYNSSQTTESGGYLHLLLEHKTATCGGGAYTRSYTSGSVSGKKTFTGGAFEARIYVPAALDGLVANFPAFWATAWPAVGEIDAWEGLATAGSCWSVHPQPDDEHPAGCVAPTVGWHTFGAVWHNGQGVDVYYDGRPVGHMPYAVTSAEYVVLDNATAVWSSVVAPADLKVDYVRHWAPS